MTSHLIAIGALTLALLLSGCGAQTPAPASPEQEEGAYMETEFTVNTSIQTVMDDPAFGEFGRLLFPAEDGYWSGETLGDLRLTFYNHIDPDKTVEIVNTLKERALAGETIFYDIYTDEEKAADPDKEDTGLFFSKGSRGRGSPCAMPAGPSPMWGPCTTVSPTPWSCPNRATTP